MPSSDAPSAFFMAPIASVAMPPRTEAKLWDCGAAEVAAAAPKTDDEEDVRRVPSASFVTENAPTE
ncbi:hypothetical protein D3C80_2185360 [compost metagenome]